MRKSNLQVAFDTWGPIKITADERARKLWSKVSRESLHRAFITLRRSGATTAFAESDKDSEIK